MMKRPPPQIPFAELFADAVIIKLYPDTLAYTGQGAPLVEHNARVQLPDGTTRLFHWYVAGDKKVGDSVRVYIGRKRK
jgi:hypothetical protein